MHIKNKHVTRTDETPPFGYAPRIPNRRTGRINFLPHYVNPRKTQLISEVTEKKRVNEQYEETTANPGEGHGGTRLPTRALVVTSAKWLHVRIRREIHGHDYVRLTATHSRTRTQDGWQAEIGRRPSEELRADLAVLQEPSAFFKESGLLSGVACESIFSAPERLNCSTWWYRACVDAMAHDTSPARRKGRGTLRSGAAATAASPTAVVESAAATAAAQA